MILYVLPDRRCCLSDFDLKTSSRDDTLWKILSDLGGVPHLGNDELNDARDTAIELQLTNRFARTEGELSSNVFLRVSTHT